MGAAALVLPGLGLADFTPSDLPHAHEGPRHVAIDATHHAQPTHIDSSSIRVEWSCSICLSQNRKGERAGPVPQALYRSAAVTLGAAASRTVPIGRQTRLQSSRAPPRSP